MIIFFQRNPVGWIFSLKEMVGYVKCYEQCLATEAKFRHCHKTNCSGCFNVNLIILNLMYDSGSSCLEANLETALNSLKLIWLARANQPRA